MAMATPGSSATCRKRRCIVTGRARLSCKTPGTASAAPDATEASTCGAMLTLPTLIGSIADLRLPLEGHAAVDAQDLPRNEGRLVGRKKRDRIGDVLDGPEAAQ